MTAGGWRVGQGFDAHRFAAHPARNKPLRLALLDWPGEPPLEGHSDGDAAIHALVDAIAAAAGLGDIGTLFGTDRKEFQGADSRLFLTETVRLTRARGFAVENASLQIVGERPRVARRAGEAADGIGQVIGAPVAVSATTTDHMGFTGRGEGIAALAVCLLRPTGNSAP
ncbi:MAG: 2-C-methyl-D-erythritol 2,4-cyclodiphosphate synthase [Bifidobacteriaceae bacterium]|jgi:2-C-methyl-D-erythritol 2,4-cyclodiphosphate synthase|nr:2-C-methyl-D-erythritol 2,4-cyclodiphosphate synthase [Bifidobacteriaceae bacterium]